MDHFEYDEENKDELLYILPRHMREGVKRYIEEGCEPGNFLSAIIQNKLKESFQYADDININKIRDFVQYFFSHAPAICWGSEERMENWIKRQGLKGIREGL